MKTHDGERRPDWMEWNKRNQQWMIQVWDPAAPGKEVGRSMHVLLTDEQADVLFAGMSEMQVENGS